MNNYTISTGYVAAAERARRSSQEIAQAVRDVFRPSADLQGVPYIRHHGYLIKENCCDGVAVGNWICAFCEEIFDVPTKHDCWPRPPADRSDRARRFYRWCKANGYVKGVKPLSAPTKEQP